METREAYKQKYEAQVKEWGAKVDVLKARAEKAEAQAKLDLAPHVNGVEEKYKAARAKLEDIAQATDDKWNDIKLEVDKVWHDFEQSVSGAFAAMKAHGKTNNPKTKN